MTRLLATLATALVILLAHTSATAAPKRESKRAYKPAERRQQEARASADAQAGAQAAPDGGGATATPSTSYEQELQAAREKRDQQLADATAAETDRRTLEKKKQQIFAQYAAIVAALRDQYEAAHADSPSNVQQPPTKSRTRAKAGRPQTDPDPAPTDPSPTRRNRGKKSPEDPAAALADAQAKLDEENTRHQARLEQLNAQLEQARSSDNQRAVRAAQKAIEKENNSYNARKAILERKLRDAGGSPTPPAEPAAK